MKNVTDEILKSFLFGRLILEIAFDGLTLFKHDTVFKIVMFSFLLFLSKK